MKLKICGMRDKENIMAVAGLNPGYMGFIFYPHSKRFVGNDFELPENFPENILKTGVFVNASVEEMTCKIEQYSLDLVQLHGNESIQICRAIRTKAKVIKVFSIDSNFDFQQTTSFNDVADYFLFDTKGVFYGGNGVSFDWNKLNEYDQALPFFLSGGLAAANIDAAMELPGNLHALDINSGVEDFPGVKNVDAVNDCVNRVNKHNKHNFSHNKKEL